MTRCQWGGCVLAALLGVDATYIQARFNACRLENAKFTASMLQNCALEECTFNGVDFSQAVATMTSLYLSQGEGLNFNLARFTQCLFTRAMPFANFTQAHLEGSNFAGANLASSSFDELFCDTPVLMVRSFVTPRLWLRTWRVPTSMALS